MKHALSLPAVVLAAVLAACQASPPPTPAEIEAVAMHARQAGDHQAERKVRSWAGKDMPVAERELALIYQARPERRAEALSLFEQAARAGDTEAAFELGQMRRAATPGQAVVPASGAARACQGGIDAGPAGGKWRRRAARSRDSGALAGEIERTGQSTCHVPSVQRLPRRPRCAARPGQGPRTAGRSGPPRISARNPGTGHDGASERCLARGPPDEGSDGTPAQ